MQKMKSYLASRAAYTALITLIYLAVIFAMMMPGTASRYHSEANGSAIAAVAKFDVSHDTDTAMQTIDLTGLKPGDVKYVSLTVTNNSEVSISYQFSWKSFDSIPLDITITAGGSGIIHWNAANKTKTHTLTISWNDENNDVNYAALADAVIVTLDYEQID